MPSLQEAVAAFVRAESWAGSRLVLQRHPELLTADADALLTRLAADDPAYRSYRDLLRRCRTEGADGVFAELTGPDVPAGLRQRWADAELAHERHRADQRPATLAAAITDATAVLADPLSHDVAPAVQAGLARAAAVLLVERHLRRDRPADLDSAVDLLRRAVAVTDVKSPDRPELLSALGNVLGMRYEEHGRPADLDAGIAAVRDALHAGDALAPEQRRALAHNLAANLGVRAEILGDPAALDEAVASARVAVAGDPDHEDLPAFLHGLGSVLLTRYERDGTLTDLREAAAAAEQGLARDPLPELRALLGMVRQLQFDRDHHGATLDAAVDLLSEAAAELGGGAHAATVLGHLGNALLTRFELHRRRADLDAARRMLRRALAAAGPGSPRAAALRSSLGLVLLERHRHAGGRLGAATRTLRRAVRDGGEGRLRPYLLANLAYAREAAADRRRTRRAVAAATRAYRSACAEALAGQPEIALTAARRWGAWAARRREWAEAAQAYDLALAASEQLWHAQAGRADKEIWLGAARGVPDRAGHAKARAGDPHSAVVALEQGRARLLAEALRGRSDQLTRLDPALAQRYRTAAAHVRQVETTPR
ncbi:MAG: hypothetical protein AB7V44_01035 [Pseudonocardia sp.]